MMGIPGIQPELREKMLGGALLQAAQQLLSSRRKCLGVYADQAAAIRQGIGPIPKG